MITASLSTEAPAAPPAARYRVQAASPGLAMLSEIDRSGDDVLPLQVAVGNVPGYGRVTKISQRGSEWVVQTEEKVGSAKRLDPTEATSCRDL